MNDLKFKVDWFTSAALLFTACYGMNPINLSTGEANKTMLGVSKRRHIFESRVVMGEFPLRCQKAITGRRERQQQQQWLEVARLFEAGRRRFEVSAELDWN